MKLLLATTNKSKIDSYGLMLTKLGFEFVTLNELDLICDVKETGTTPVENAIIKAKSWNSYSSLPTLAIDDGLYFENIPQNVQPGTNVRRINGKRLSDIEMLNYYINMVNTYGNNNLLKGYFLISIAICNDKETFHFEYKSYRSFTNKQSNVILDGYPLESIQFIQEINKFRSELTKDEKELIDIVDQREIFDFIEETLTNLN